MGKKLPFNNYRVENGVVFIDLTQGQVAMIDADDLPLVQGYRWYAVKVEKTFYAVTNIRINGKRQQLRMHNAVLPLIEGYTPDHRNRVGVDNRRGNLRYANPKQQAQNQSRRTTNSSGYRGVSWDNKKRKWLVQAHINGKNTVIGAFDKIEDAISARKAWDEANNIPPSDMDEAVIARHAMSPPPQPKQPILRKDNKSGFRGVSWVSRDKKWHMQASICKTRYDLGYFDSLEDAVTARRAFDEAHNIPLAQST